MENCLSKKAEMPTLDVDPGDSLFHFPLPLTVNSPTTTSTTPPPFPQIDPAALGNYVKSGVKFRP